MLISLRTILKSEQSVQGFLREEAFSEKKCTNNKKTCNIFWANLRQYLTGFGTLIQLLNTLQLENAALKTEITKNEANIEINNGDIKANADSIVSLLLLEHSFDSSALTVAEKKGKYPPLHQHY